MANKKTHVEVLLEFLSSKNNMVIAEIGVFKGKLTDNLLYHCSNKIKEYWAIDKWEKFDGLQYGRYSNWTQEIWDVRYKHVCKLMVKHQQLRVVKLSSENCASLFDTPYFDFVYLDATHFYESVKKDIEVWYPLIKSGGYIGGHDYGSRSSSCGISHDGVQKAVCEKFDKEKILLLSDHVWLVEKQ